MRGLTVSLLVLVAGLPGFCQGWNPKLAADYLDARQQAWNAWRPAKAPGGACFSCHTSMTYLLARSSLRRALGEPQPTPMEKAALDGLRARAGMRDAGEIGAAFAKEPLAAQAMGVEAIFAALFLARQDSERGTMSPQTEQAFERMWALQARDGKEKGPWAWFHLDLDPWETPDSDFYGATLAAMALRAAPAAYRERPDVRNRMAAVTEYLQAAQKSQPLHNRLMLLWAGVLPETLRRQIAAEVMGQQQADGGWTIASLGPWKDRPDAPASTGSNAYATGFVALVLVRAGVAGSNGGLARALEWLRGHQDQHGYWDAASMNKHYKAGSMPEGFMRDAATAFAAAALADARPSGIR
jgi:squalene-hopene/tetraprenyl-beta-curcumene cyclase